MGELVAEQPIVTASIATQRLHNQCLGGASHQQPEDVVSWFGAMQAQEYASAAWGIGVRLRAAAASTIDEAFDAGRILRTHVMRPTWHFVLPADIGWMLQLTAPRVHRMMSSTFRSFELDTVTSTRAAAVFEKVVAGGGFVTRAELSLALEREGITAKGIRLALLTVYAELEGILCSGPRHGKHMTYASLSARAARKGSFTRDEAIAALTTRYFRSHGPATARDFAWWSGLTSADVKRGLDIVRARSTIVDGLTYWTVGEAPRRRKGAGVHLLPNYDEYLVAYRDLVAVPRKAGIRGILQRALVINGEIAGTWRADLRGGDCTIAVEPYRRLTNVERLQFPGAFTRYQRFIHQPAR